MLAASRTYGQGLARSTLSTSRCSRPVALGPGSGALSRVASVYPVSARVERRLQHSGGGAPPPDDRSLTAEEERSAPWLKYQRSLYKRTGLQGLGTSRRLGEVSPSTAAASAGPTTTPEKTDGLKLYVGSPPSSAGATVKDAAAGGEALSPAPTPSKPAAKASAMTPAASTAASEKLKPDDSGSAIQSPACPATTTGDQALQQTSALQTPRTATDFPAEELSLATPPPQDTQNTGSKRRKRGRRGRGKGGRQADGAGTGAGTVTEGSKKETRRDLAGEGEGVSDLEVVAENSSSRGGAVSPAPRKRGRSRARGSAGEGAAAEAAEAGAAAAAAAGSVGGSGGSTKCSHYQKQRSAWRNIHAKKNLKRLLVGLGNDYGVQEILGEHHVSQKTLSKLLPMFQDLVLNDPNTALDGKGCQKTQKMISDLCYHDSFAADAVLMKKPIQVKGKSASGRTYVFPSPPAKGKGKGGKRGRETGFLKMRNDLVKHQFIPRLVRLAQEKFPKELEVAKRMDTIVDLRNPHQAFPLARLRKRRIIYHGGPTNSGKTYQAIERLKKAGVNRQPGDGPVGLFCGPLRLLALEVYEQLNSQGVYCNLMTGQEKREVPFATHVSCTIEMASTENEYEVAVVDEIQMLADEQRGPSWTAAILGLNCPEIHVCGGMEGALLVEAMANEMGDDFELREYQRKTELVCAEDSLSSSYKNIQPGDAVVAFSRKDIFNIKREIETQTPHKCCVIFGSLPQETRAHQARLFNTEDTGYDVLVASDAIGMGLNLNIRRVVFHAVAKRGVGGGRTAVKLPPTVLKQIGGRAGRHGKQWEFGEVTCLRASDMQYMKQVMNTPLESLPKAAIFPSVQRMQEFSNCLDETEPEDQERRRLAETYAAFAQRTKVGDRYFLGTHDQYQTLANMLHPIENLTLKERYTISMAPVNGRNALLVRAIFLFASAHAAGLPVFINMQLPQKGVIPKSMSEFQTLCSKHNVLDLYRWMGVRYPSIECFAEKSVADIQRLELESMINEALKRKIAVAGPDSISAPEHDTFDKKVIRALNDPKGAAFSITGARGGVENEDEEDGVEYQL